MNAALQRLLSILGEKMWFEYKNPKLNLTYLFQYGINETHIGTPVIIYVEKCLIFIKSDFSKAESDVKVNIHSGKICFYTPWNLNEICFNETEANCSEVELNFNGSCIPIKKTLPPPGMYKCVQIKYIYMECRFWHCKTSVILWMFQNKSKYHRLKH